MSTLLNASSPRKRISNINVNLFPHQEAIVYKMLLLEAAASNGRNIFAMKDSAGAGKSYVMLSVILNEKRLKGKTQNLFVVPGNIYSQWKFYIHNFSSELTVASFLTYGDITALYHDTSYLTSVDILITTSVFYHTIAQTVEQIQYVFDRVILDEIDSISFFTSIRMPSKNIWLISATTEMMTNDSIYKNLYHDFVQTDPSFIKSSINLPEIVFHRYLCHNRNIHLLGPLISPRQLAQVNALDYTDFVFNFIGGARTITSVQMLVKSLFQNYYGEMHSLEEQVLKYIRELNQGNPLRLLHEISQCLNKAMCTKYNDQLKKMGMGYPTRKQLEALINQIVTEQQVEEVLKEYKVSKVLASLKLLLLMPSEVETTRQQNLTVHINNNRKRVSEIEKKLQMVIERIEEKTCPVCLEDFDFNESKKVVLGCCQNSFCITCMKEMLLRSDRCPTCRSQIDQENVNVFDGEREPEEPVIEEEEPPEELPLSAFENNDSDKDVVYKEIVKDVMTNARSRLLIFSDYHGTFNMVRKFLQEENFRFEELDGSIKRIEKVVNDYRLGIVKILVINSLAYGAGLNLENTTDIILMHNSARKEQFIGRAQRIGRKSALHVHELKYPDETTE